MPTDYKRLYRSTSDRMFSGLCGGLGQYAGIDPTIVRLIFALGTIFFFPAPVIIYLAMMVIVPEEPAGNVVVPSPEVIE